MNELGKILKQARVTAGLSLRDLAAQSGVSTSHLGRIETGERFPSARILRKISQPLGSTEDKLFAYAGYLSRQSSGGVDSEIRLRGLDPYVARVLSKEPVEVQRAIIGILYILKGLAAVIFHNSAEYPEFGEYLRCKYPNLNEDLITMMEDLIAREVSKQKSQQDKS